jgi:hypothetical protein
VHLALASDGSDIDAANIAAITNIAAIKLLKVAFSLILATLFEFL